MIQYIFTLLTETFSEIFDFYNLISNTVYMFYSGYSREILDFFHILFDNTFYALLYLTVFLAFFYCIMSIAILRRKKRNYGEIQDSQAPKVTIQIPTYNELAALHCAKKCLQFDYPKDKIQIIIGDDSNNKEISKKIDEFAKKHKEVQVTRRGENIGYKPGNLNHMLDYTKGEFIVIFDSDFLPPPDFLRKAIAPFKKDNKISVVQVKWNIYNFSQNVYSILGGSISLLCHNVALPFISMFKGNTYLCGSAEAIRKKDLLEVGKWKAGMLTEDVECSLRLMKKGKRLVFIDYIDCKCEAPHTLLDLCKQQMRWGYGVITAFKMHLIDILKSKKVNFSDKLSVMIFVSGYLFSLLILLLTVFGSLSIITNRPEPIDWGLFLSKTFTNIALTSGFIITSVVALGLSKKIRLVPKMILASFSVGLVVTYYVNIGIFKAIFGRQMQWIMLKKNGNKITQ